MPTFWLVTRNVICLYGSHKAAWCRRSGPTGFLTRDSNIEAKHPDEFVLDQIDINDRILWGCVQQIANSRQDPPETVDDVLSQLERSGLVQSAAALRRNWNEP
jgi:hypothetical protein